MCSLGHFERLEGWTLEGESFHCILYIYLCNFKRKKARVLQTSLWILVDCSVDGVFSTCYCKFVYVFHISLLLLFGQMKW